MGGETFQSPNKKALKIRAFVARKGQISNQLIADFHTFSRLADY
jgi:hypothetical protein